MNGEPARRMRSISVTRSRAIRTMDAAGFVGGVLWVGVAVASPEAEVARNRVWTVALVGMLLGVLGLWFAMRPLLSRIARIAFALAAGGLGIMAVGSFVEYWLLFQLPHEGGTAGSMARGLAFMTFLVGVLVLLVASTTAGTMMLLAKVVPRSPAMLMTLLVPLTVGLALVTPALASLPIAALSSLGAFPLRTHR